MEKKHDLPAFPFYFGDWRKAPEIRALDLDVRMIWFEMLGVMWESTERGYLTLNGKPVSDSVISRVISVSVGDLQRAVRQMEQFNVFSRRDDGAIYCRKMVRDEEIRVAKSRAGKEGMKIRYGDVCYNRNAKAVITEYEDEKKLNNKEKGGVGGKENLSPTIEEVKLYFVENGYLESVGDRAWKYYDVAGWKDSQGKKVLNWKQKMRSVWFKDENKVRNNKQQKLITISDADEATKKVLNRGY